MKATLVTLTLLISASCYAAPAAIQPSIKTWEEGAALVMGQVIENNHGCETDGVCYLILRIDNKEVRVYYNLGEGERCFNDQSKLAWHINKGDWIKAFGDYTLRKDIYFVSACSSPRYFIRRADDGTPLEPVTERFLQEVAKRKTDIAKKQFEETKQSGAWKTHANKQLGYEFRYPATWSEPDRMMGDEVFSIYYQDHSLKNGYAASLTLGFISEAQIALMGIDFCDANPDDKRCERKKIGNVSAAIDWGDNDKFAFAKIPRPAGGFVTFTLKPNTSKAKSLFIPILETFKFLN